MTAEEAARECIEKIGSALGFFSSVIKSGESWSETCEDEMTRVRTALANYRAAYATITSPPPAASETGAGVERGPRGCPTPGACSCIDLVPDAASDIRISQVAKEARDTLASWMISHGYATGHGDSIEGLLGELGAQIDDQRRELVALLEAHDVREQAAVRNYETEIYRLREENIELRNSHAAVVQEAYERLSTQRADIARKDEALREARKTIVAWAVPNPPDVIAAACAGVDAALQPLAPGSKGDAS